MTTTKTTIDTITDAQIDALKHEQGAAGDHEQIALCEIATGHYDLYEGVEGADVYVVQASTDYPTTYGVLAFSEDPQPDPERWSLIEVDLSTMTLVDESGPYARWEGAEPVVQWAREQCVEVISSAEAMVD